MANINVAGTLHSTAEGNVIANANEIYDTTKQAKQSAINADHESRITTNENAIRGLDAQNYVTLEASATDLTIADVFDNQSQAVTPAINTIYRIANWNGNADGDAQDPYYNTAYYSEYAANGTTTAALVLLNVVNRGVDDTPTAGSDNLVKSGGVAEEISVTSRLSALDYKEVDAEQILNKYIDNSGNIQSYNGYYYTKPFYVPYGYTLVFPWNNPGMNGMSFLSTATSADDDGSNGYTPVSGMNNGSTAKGIIYYFVNEAGYFVVSWKEHIAIPKPVMYYGYIPKELVQLKSSISSLIPQLEILINENNSEKEIGFNYNPEVSLTSNSAILNLKFTAVTDDGAVGWFYYDNNKIINNNNQSSGSETYSLAVNDILVLDLEDRLLKKKTYPQSLEGSIVLLYHAKEGQYYGKLAEYVYSSLVNQNIDRIDDETSFGKSILYDYSSIKHSGYVDTDGNIVEPYNNYFYTDPIPVTNGQYLIAKVLTSGQAIICKTNSSGTSRTPVVVIPSGFIYDGLKLYRVEEDGYICFSARTGDTLHISNDPRDNQDYNELKGSITELKNEVAALGEDGVPSYYFNNDYLENRCDAINAALYDAGEGADGFIFITDTHNIVNAMKSPVLIKHLLKNTFIDKVFHGGDIVGTYSESTKEANTVGVQNDLMRQLMFTSAITPYGKLYTARGNHDICSYGNNSSVIYGLNADNVHNLFMNKLNPCYNVVSNEDDEDANYFYFDNESQKLRYIVFDTSDTVNSTTGETTYKVSNPQMYWIAAAVLATPNDYNIVFIVHIPVVRNASSDTSYTYVTNVATLCDGVKNKKSNVTLGERTFDFSNLGADLIMVLGGHTHGDVETYVDGVLHVSTGSDGHIGDSIWFSLFSDSNFKTKVVGTIREQLFDVVVVSPQKQQVTLFRIGGSGYDRIFYLEPNSVSVGNTIELDAGGTVETWDYSDSDGLTFGSSGNIPVPSQTRISVSNGIVTGVEQGEAIVCATMADSKIRKFFYIKVV